jgi:hypothetical protein
MTVWIHGSVRGLGALRRVVGRGHHILGQTVRWRRGGACIMCMNYVMYIDAMYVVQDVTKENRPSSDLVVRGYRVFLDPTFPGP